MIALLTDFGLEGGFVGVMKGVIYSINPEAKIVDITHNLTPHDIEEGAFYILTSYKYFPENTIFVVVVDPGVGGRRRIILTKSPKYCFIAPDNGILSWVLREEKAEKVLQVTQDKYFLKPISSTFHGRDIFAPVAGYLSKGIPISEFGDEIEDPVSISFPEPIVRKEKIEGRVLLIDRFGNAITNLSLKRFPFLKDSCFRLRMKTVEVTRVLEHYLQGRDEDPFLIAGSSGFWEISLSRKSFAKKYHIKRGDEFTLSLSLKPSHNLKLNGLG